MSTGLSLFSFKVSLEDTDKSKNNLEPKVEVPTKKVVPDNIIKEKVKELGAEQTIKNLVATGQYTQEEATEAVNKMLGTYGRR